MAFLQPPEDRQPAFNIPAAVGALIAAFIAVHIARVYIFAGQSEAILERYAFNPALYSQAFLAAHNFATPSLWARAIPFVSYIFLHGDFTHLAINSLWLLAFGPVVARRFGGALFLLFFFICGIAAALVQLACSWGDFEPVIGASGAISGLMAAGIRMLPLQDMRNPTWHPVLPLTSPQVLVFSLIWVVINVASGLTGFAGVGSELRLIAWQAHLGGYAAGLLLTDLFERLRREPSDVDRLA
jgi:membrane associated rhomboid family serine protease